MAMNIKNEEAHRLAQELARKTGTSITEAVIRALKSSLDSINKKAEASKRKDETLQLVRQMRADNPELNNLNEPYDAFLYDENGLPK